VGGTPHRAEVGSGVGCLYWLDGGAPAPLSLQCVCGICGVPFWQGKQMSLWFWWWIARCLANPAFIFLSPGISTPHFGTSYTSAYGLLIRCCVSSDGVHVHSALAIMAILRAEHMSDCSSCTRPPCLAIVADMLNTYKRLVAFKKWDCAITSTRHASVASSKVCIDWFLHFRAHLSCISSAKFGSWKQLERQLWGLHRQMPCSTSEVSHYWLVSIGHLASYVFPLFVIHIIDAGQSRYGYTHIRRHAASGFCCFWSLELILNVCPAPY